MNEMKKELSFVTKTRNKLAVKKLAKTLAILHTTKYKFYKDGKYIPLARFKNSKVNKSLVSEYLNDFATDGYQTFPKYLQLCMRKGCKTDLFLCVYYEPYCPNWNNEYEIIKVIPMSEVTCKVVESLDDIAKVDSDIENEWIMLNAPKIGKDLPDYGKQPNKTQLADLINKGMRCVYRKGWAYRGAKATDISKEVALDKLRHYNYEMGFHMLSYKVTAQTPTLEFNEVSALDME